MDLQAIKGVGDALQPWGFLTAAIVGLWTIVSQHRANIFTFRELDINRQKFEAEKSVSLFIAAVDKLKLDAKRHERIAAVNMLNYITAVSPKQLEAVTNIFISFIREASKNFPKEKFVRDEASHFFSRSEDFQIMFDTIGTYSRVTAIAGDQRLDLKYCILFCISLFRREKKWERVNLSSCHLFRCVLTDGFILDSYFHRTIITSGKNIGMTISDCSFQETRFNEVEMTNCKLSNCTFDDSQGKLTFNNCDLVNCKFSGSNFEELRFDRGTTSGCSIERQFSGKILFTDMLPDQLPQLDDISQRCRVN